MSHKNIYAYQQGPDWKIAFRGRPISYESLVGIYKLKEQHMKNPLTKHDVPPTKYDDPLAFNKTNSTKPYHVKTLLLSQDHP